MTISLTDPNPDVLDPIVEANMLPVQTKVSNSLSEDTLWADVMLPPSGRNAVALFANPFADHTEEMLYIDPQGQLAWARHSSGDTAGWTEELLTDPGDRAYEVVTVVHPNNVVFAFVLVASGTPVQPNLRTYCLERSALGGVGWVLVPNPQPMPPLYNPSQLSVYYPATRPLVPWVFLTEDHIGNPVVVPIVAEAPTDDTGPGTGMWWTADPVLGVPFDNLAGAEVLCGVDNPLEQPSMVVWVLTPDQVLVQCTYPAPGKVNKDIVLEHVLAMAGLYVTPRGVGVVAVQAGPQPTLSTLVVVSRVVDGARTSWKVVSNPVDFSMSSAQAWQDQQGYLHVFGKHGTDVHVVHQIDYTVEPGSSALIPRFTMLDAGLGPVALSTSIATSVSSFTVDSCPDQYPSQFVLHTAPEPVGEQWAIYTQDVETSWWSRENVRFQSNPQVYSAARYKSQITLLDSYGGPVQGYPVALSSGQSVEVEVAGRYYRLGPGVQPAQLTTDFLGRVTVKVIAASLGGTTLSLSAQGMPGSTTINPAVDVHNYLAGSGTLPNHPAVITAEALQDAKDSAGDWVFPAWHVLDHGLGAVPTADQVLGWCAELFEPPSGASRMVSGADGEPVLARYLSLQTSDSSRPAFETFGPDDDVDLGWDGVVEMAGDFWEAIRSGAIAVKKTVIDLAAGLARITVAGYDNVEYAFTVVWDKVIEAAHVVEAIFNSLLAKISAVIDWLKWTMDIKDVFETKDAMTGMLLQLPDLLENYLNAVFVDIVPGWFTSKRGLVEQYLDLAIQFATNPISEPPGPRATGRREPRLPGAPELSEFEFADQPELLRDPSKLDNPHVMWWLDQIISLSQSPGSSPVASPGQDDPPSWAVKVIQAMKDVIATLGDSPAGVELGKAYDEFAAFVLDCYDPTDFLTTFKRQIIRMLSFARHLIVAILDFCEEAVGNVRDLIVEAVRCITTIAGLPADSAFGGLFVRLWDYLRTAAGRPEEPMTVANLYGFMVAYPLTICFKALRGVAPCPGGVFPDLTVGRGRQVGLDAAPTWLPAGSKFRQPEDYVVPPEWQCLMQVMVGIGSVLNATSDVYLDYYSKHRDFVHHQPWNDTFLSILVWWDLVVFFMGDMPIFYGLGKEPDKVEKLWWGEWVPKAFIYLGDVILVQFGGFVKDEWRRTKTIIGLLEFNVAFGYFFVASVVELVFTNMLYINSDHNPNDVFWLWTQYVGAIPGLFSLMRIRLPLIGRGTQSNWGLGIKVAKDITANAVSGSALLYAACVASDYNLQFRPDRIIVGDLPDGVAGTRYVNENGNDPLLTLDPNNFYKGWTPVGWAVQGGGLPSGLKVTPAGSDNSILQFSGSTDFVGDQTFEIWSVNSYDPNIIVKRSFTVKFTAAPPPDGPASIETEEAR